MRKISGFKIAYLIFFCNICRLVLINLISPIIPISPIIQTTRISPLNTNYKKNYTMRRKLLLTITFTIALVCSTAAQKVAGGDLSLVPAYEQADDVWLDADGHEINTHYSDGMLTYLKEVAGWNAVRVRLLVDPSADNLLATCQDLDYVKQLGKRVKTAGMAFLLDIFYSDTWTDVSAQWMPKSWGFNKNTPTATVAAKVKSYTTEVLNNLNAYGAKPDYIQIGNEVSYGMLWDTAASASTSNAFYLYGTYSTFKTQIDRFATLLKAAAEGIRASDCANAKIILHCERTANAGNTINFYDWVGQAGFDDYDIMGLSYYPQWHGTLDMLKSTLKELHDTFEEKEIQLVETGYFNNSSVDESKLTYNTSATWAFSPAGQAAFLKDLIAVLKSFDCVTGLYYWQPEECGNGADADGNKRVMDGWDNRGFWQLTWKSGRHALQSADALMSMATFLKAGEEPADGTDVSDKFTNLDFEQCEYNEAGGYVTTCPGWDINYETKWSSGPWPVKVNEWHSSLTDGFAFQGWNARGNSLAAGYILRQSAEELPAGTYTVTAAVHADYDGVSLFANNESAAVTTTSEWGTAFAVKVVTELKAPGSLTIGLQFDNAISTSSEINLYADNFKVMYSPAASQLRGDVNADGKVDISDVVAVINQMAGTASYKAADVNNDNEVNISDVVAVINIMAGQ